MDLDYYRGFDPIFFRENCREESSKLYRTALENPDNRRDFHFLTMREIRHPSMIPKPYMMSITPEHLAGRVGVELVGSQRAYCRARIHAHLTRLLLPVEYYTCGGSMYFSNPFQETSGADTTRSKTFAREFIQHVATLPQEKRPDWTEPETRSQRFVNMASSESLAVFNFWTLVPHVHAEMKLAGLPTSESIERIINWAAYAREDRDNYEFYLAGSPDVDSQLGFDERMPSHLLARMEAIRVMPYVIEVEK